MTIYLTVEEGATGIPYGRPDDDPNSHSYVSLRLEPEAINDLPELSREPLLKEIVRRLNGEDTVLETVGCETWETENNGVHNKGSYIAIIFTDPEVGDDARDWFPTFFNLSQCLHEHPEQSHAINITCRLKGFVMHRVNRSGFQMELWVNGYWDSPENAHKLWASFLQECVKWILEITSGIHASIKAGKVTN